jgi:hypothetical protein
MTRAMTTLLPVARGANAALCFFLELAVYIAVGYWGFKASPRLALKLLAGLGAPLALAVVWGTFASPRAPLPVHGLARAALEFGWFGAGAAALAATGRHAWAVAFGATYLVNAALRWHWHQ